MQAKIVDQQLVDARADLIFSPDSEFSERLEAVMEDLLEGRQSRSSIHPGLNLQLNDSEDKPHGCIIKLLILNKESFLYVKKN